MKHSSMLTLLSMALLLSACGGEADSTQARGPDPKLPEPQRGLLPSMKIAEPVAWGEQKPTVPEGFSITAIATDLRIPRQTLVLPNGDILVAEGRGGSAAKLKPKDVIASVIKAEGNTKVKGGNRLTLLRDADGDGTYELKTVFAENLNAPYGLAFADGKLYVANQDALVRFDYQDGQTKASGPPTTVTELPAAINHHWTKSLAISPDGRSLYVGIGSNSNITERGMEVEIDRAMVWQIDAATGAHKPYATGLRNPTALTIQPGSGQVWAVVNERDELGPDLYAGLPDLGARRRILRLALQLLGPERRHPRPTAEPGQGRRRDQAGLQPGFPRRRAGRRFFHPGHGREICRRRLRRRARQLEPGQSGGLQGDLRAVQQWPACR